jgi:hypothetical protein
LIPIPILAIARLPWVVPPLAARLAETRAAAAAPVAVCRKDRRLMTRLRV